MQTTIRAALSGAALLLVMSPAQAVVVGDCDGDGAVTVNEIVRGVNIAQDLQPLSACPAMDRDGDSEVTVDELLAAVRTAIDGPGDNLAFVLASDFVNGSFALIDLNLRSIEPANAGRVVGSDAVVRVHDGKIYVINRFGGDSVQVINPAANFATEKTCSTGAGSNPNDIVFVSATKAYVPLYGRPQLQIVDPSVGTDCAGFLGGSIDLAAFADSDGIPEMALAAVVGNRAYVALQRLTNFAASTPGLLVVIDTSTDQVVGSIELSGRNPFTESKGLIVRGDAIYVSEVGTFSVNDGGIERIDLTSGAAQGFVVSEAQAGGDITDFVFATDDLIYAIVSKPDFSTALIAYDLSQNAVTATLATGSLADVEINRRGELFLSDRTFGSDGVRIFRASDGTELLPAPLDSGLPPFGIVFLP